MRLDRKPPSRGSWFHCGCATNSTHPQVLDSTARATCAGLCFTYCAELLCGWMAAAANRVKVVFIYDEASCLHILSALSLSSKLATKTASKLW
jgi:hypothetical protein